MKLKEKEIYSYLKSIYLPKHFISYNGKFYVNYNLESVKNIVCQKFTLEDLYLFIISNKELFEQEVFTQLIKEILKPIYFTVEDLKEIQASDE